MNDGLPGMSDLPIGDQLLWTYKKPDRLTLGKNEQPETSFGEAGVLMRVWSNSI
jgi:hypothetical protein